MSYLDSPGITFSGDFQSDVSTVNNDVRHYNNQTFQTWFQQPQETEKGPDGKPIKVSNGWWNPEGGATFNLVNCKIKSVFPGVGGPQGEELIGLEISGAKDRAPGKMVDLDPQMQMTSELWAVKFRISAADGSLLLEGDVHPTGFRDLSQRQSPLTPTDKTYVRNGQPLGAQYTSVIENITWGEKSLQIPFLIALKEKTQANRLSIGFSVMGYYYSHVDGRFSLGKIIGSIGPWAEREPIRFAATRRLSATGQSYFATANLVVREDIISVDLGMSFPICSPLAQPYPKFNQLVLAVNTGSPVINSDTLQNIDPGTYEELGTLTLNDDTPWLLESGAFWRIPITEAQQQLIADKQLFLLTKSGENTVLQCREAAEGWYVRCDQNVVRLDPGESFTADFYVYQWGQPVAGQNISLLMERPASGGGGDNSKGPKAPTAAIPWINEPVTAVKYVQGKETDQNGKVSVTFSGTDPANPRKYLDGQIYLFDYSINGHTTDQDGLDQVFVHLRNGFEVPDEPKWSDISEIMVQYANLYPIMSKHVVDLGDPQAILKKKDLVLFAFTREINDPLYMPVTRDLSANKLATIVKWLKNPIVDVPQPENADLKLQVTSKGINLQQEEAMPMLEKRRNRVTALDLKSSETL